MKYADGAIALPTGPGLGVEFDRDPSRPDWYATVPEYRWADPGSP